MDRHQNPSNAQFVVQLDREVRRFLQRFGYSNNEACKEIREAIGRDLPVYHLENVQRRAALEGSPGPLNDLYRSLSLYTNWDDELEADFLCDLELELEIVNLRAFSYACETIGPAAPAPEYPDPPSMFGAGVESPSLGISKFDHDSVSFIVSALCDEIDIMRKLTIFSRYPKLHEENFQLARDLQLLPLVETLSSHFWPMLKDQLRALPAGEDWLNSALECPICRENMAFVGRFNEEGHFTDRAAHAMEVLGHQGVEAAAVLPCGHVMGHKCLAHILATPSMRSCPFCKGSLAYECGMPLEIVPAPMNHVQLERFTPTIPKGSQFPCGCDSCKLKIWREDWIAEVSYWKEILSSYLVMAPSSTAPFVQNTPLKLDMETDLHEAMQTRTGVTIEQALIELRALILNSLRMTKYIDEGDGSTRSWASNSTWGDLSRLGQDAC
ncbi:hypothetical protein ACHAQA_001471 [Verticillium albo-atrum]